MSRRINAALIIYALSCVILAGCSTSQKAVVKPITAKEIAEETPKAAPKKSTVAPGYEVQLTSLEDKNISGKYRIDFDGQLKLPYEVTIDCTGLTFNELKSKITSSYKPYFKTEPKLQIALSDKKYYVDVQGLVKTPGQYLVKANASLDDVISKAEGLQKDWDKKEEPRYAKITQSDKIRFIRLSDYYSGSEVNAPVWNGGDRVFFQSESGPLKSANNPEQEYVQIMGQVATPGEYLFAPKADFFHYLTKAGGPTSEANLERIDIIREEQGQKKTIEFELQDSANLPKIEGGDILLVHSQDPNTVIPNTTGVIGSIASILLVIFGI